LETKKSVSEISDFAYRGAAVGRHIEMLVEAGCMGFEREHTERERVGKGLAEVQTVSGLEDMVNARVDTGSAVKNTGSE
jgi:hypothetical protein